MGLFEEERAKVFSAVGFKNQRRNLRVQEKRTGKTTKDIDSKRHALLAGKRISKNGNTYWEGRVNRSDSKGSNI